MNLDELPGQAASLDQNGAIRATNALWRAFTGRSVGPGARPEPGESYLELARLESSPLGDLIERVLSGEAERGLQEYTCFEGTDRKHFLAVVWRLSDATTVIHLDVTVEVSARRRWAHDLNNSVTALLCYLNLGLPMLEEGSPARELLEPAEEAARQLLQLMDQRPP